MSEQNINVQDLIATKELWSAYLYDVDSQLVYLF